jgi:hypothetical protein
MQFFHWEKYGTGRDNNLICQVVMKRNKVVEILQESVQQHAQEMKDEA